MKNPFLLPLLLLLTLSVRHAHAYEANLFINSDEDTAEVLQPASPEEQALEAYELSTEPHETLAPGPYDQLNQEYFENLTQKGNWAYKISFVHKDGREEVIAQQRTQALMKPASTLKLFTGWQAYLQNVKTTTYLSSMLRRSDNVMAADTLRKIGGVQKMIQYYKNTDLPVTDDNFKPVDGSGLSHSNRVSVELMDDLLFKIYRSQHYNQFRELLAQPGEKGSLIIRLKSLKNELYAKTGTLHDVISMAGFIERDNGTLIFTIIGNQLDDGHGTRPALDRVIKKYAEFSDTLQ